MPDFQIHTLPNGLRIAYKQAFNTAVTHLGYTIHAGARDDGSLPGTAHCFEHMLFKGTQTRSAMHIINRLEVVGGEAVEIERDIALAPRIEMRAQMTAATNGGGR